MSGLEKLVPEGVHNGARAKHVTGFYPALKKGDKIVWSSDEIFRKKDFGDDAKQMARDEAERMLHCEPGSLAAEELAKACEAA